MMPPIDDIDNIDDDEDDTRFCDACPFRAPRIAASQLDFVYSWCRSFWESIQNDQSRKEIKTWVMHRPML